MATNYKNLAKIIIQNIGGKENVQSLTHCFTRLRFVLKDEAKANTDILKGTDDIVDVIQQGGQYQIVIGMKVEEVYNEIMPRLGLAEQDSLDAEEQQDKSGFSRIIDTISGIFMPLLGLLTACGIIKGLLAVLSVSGLLQTTDGTYVILNAVGDSLFYFFPVFLGYTAAKKFKMNELVGMAVGASLIYPTIISSISENPISTLFSGTIIESGVHLTFLQIPVLLSNYSSTVIPAILAVWFASKIEKQVKKIAPASIRNFFVPLFTLLIAVPVVFIVVGPIATWASDIVGAFVQVLYSFSPVLFGAFVGGFWQIFVMLGIHQGMIPIVINNLATLGYDTIFAATCTASFTQLAILVAIVLRTKNKRLKNTATAAIFPAIFGITEPAIYGVTLPLKKPFVISCVSSGIGGALAMVLGVKFYQMGGQGIFSFPCYLNPESGNFSQILMSIIAIVVAMAISFIATLFLYRDKQATDDKVEQKAIIEN
ncbi:PTS transporter subunit EIIC [Enterococcus sp. HY326]|uniref:PTS transporter subunit EIIC n=1 Tax=Enterococcus sp. HY326 TaxID=2971265 RepID=UPI0022400003|nr:PTS transporter subunit EIIC [Enterococcus sp. HY326]